MNNGITMKQHEQQHFSFLDGLRFWCAIWVVFSHLGAPPIFAALSGIIPVEIAHIAQNAFGVIFNGTAAVVAFFIISGFCIHFPYTSGKQFDLRSFYLARFTRIVIPMLIAIGLALALPNGYDELEKVLWSLYCEVIYYAIYPVLRVILKGRGLPLTLGLTFAASILVSAIPDSQGGFLWVYGIWGSALLGLPIWMLGCYVAEAIRHGRTPQFLHRPGIGVLLRMAVIILCGTTVLLHFRTGIKLKYSMLLFAPLCAAWILYEFNQRPSFWLFKRFSGVGKGCYSIYLVHKLALPTLYFLSGAEPNTVSWPIAMIAVAGVSTAFYVCVERPSHMLSRRLSSGAWSAGRKGALPSII